MFIAYLTYGLILGGARVVGTIVPVKYWGDCWVLELCHTSKSLVKGVVEAVTAKEHEYIPVATQPPVAFKCAADLTEGCDWGRFNAEP